MIVKLSDIANSRKILIICDGLDVYTAVSNILKRNNLKIEIYPYMPLKEELVYHDVIIIVKPRDCKKLIKNYTTVFYTYLSADICFLLDLVAAMKGEFVKKVDIGVDPGLSNIGIAVIADGILVMGETLSTIHAVIRILNKITVYEPPINRIKIKIGNGENYKAFLEEILQIEKTKLGRFDIEIVDEAQAKSNILSIKNVRDKNVIDALKILTCKGYRRIQ
ncbi:MAG: hypothetical protein DRJ38_02430 [Thermoprotei archaeon]|nr:MAG: hypothetical protein DRJ38_02430 [Thermoprotei archaeon]